MMCLLLRRLAATIEKRIAKVYGFVFQREPPP